MEGLVKMPYDVTVRVLLASLERNLVPDMVVRRLTRLLLATRLRSGYKPSSESQLSDLVQFAQYLQAFFRMGAEQAPLQIISSMLNDEEIKEWISGKGSFMGMYEMGDLEQALQDMPIAIKTDKPKTQHYELPTSFFKLVLGKNMKYSCCYFCEKSSTLEDAENTMLELYCERAQVKDGHTILDVGCGWGSLSLYLAQKYRNCKITGLCNSTTQKAYIEEKCRELQLQNVEIVVADISTFEMEGSFDRIFSIEMFEDGLLFVHYFCHKAFAYHFEDLNDDDWITRYFFTGGTMPSANLLLYFQEDVSVLNHWLVNGKHYAQTSEEWLKRMDQNLASIKPIMESSYGKDAAVKWTVYWRTFFISVAELFGYNNGEEWMVAHFLFKKK